MAQSTMPVAVEVPMSWAQFLAPPTDVRAEYADGKALVTPPPSFAHQEVCQRLRDVLKRTLGTTAVVAVGVGWRLPGDALRLRIPDVMLLAEPPSEDVVTAAPLVVFEVLSSNRTDNLVRKSTEYLDAGASHYWVVDPRDRVIDVLARGRGGWRRLARITDETPHAAVPIPQFGTVTLSLAEILA